MFFNSFFKSTNQTSKFKFPHNDLLFVLHSKFFQILSFLSRDSSEIKKLKEEILNLKQQLAKISMRENYISYVKVERKITTLEAKINESKNDQGKQLILKYALNYGIQFVFGSILVIISLYYRYNPVIVFEDRFNFSPFTSIMNFPTGINNAISVPFWIFVNNYVSRTISSYIQ